MDKPFIFGMPNLTKKGIFINTATLSWRWKINNKKLF